MDNPNNTTLPITTSSNNDSNNAQINQASQNPIQIDTSNNRDQFLRQFTHLNKLSHKISKPTRPPTAPTLLPEPPSQPQQPPVYNINKSDFRDVVQKLTGSPAHTPSPSVPAIHAPHNKPGSSSRLQRIRPPPLAQLTHRPISFPGHPPLSPLPPLPSSHFAADSPISAYMRFLHGQPAMMMFPPPDNLENVPPPSTSGESSSIGLTAAPPSLPLPFGCLPSPKSPCPLLSPNLLLPLSPTVSSASSPKWRDC